MADTPVPGGAQRGVVKAPNNTEPGNHAANGYLPLGGSAGAVHPPNTARPGDHRGGSYPPAGRSSPVQTPNHRFNVGMAQMPQPGSAETPGEGDVPVGAGTLGMPAAEMRAKK